MKSLTIGFSKPKDDRFAIYSWLIRAVCKTPYSHVYVKFPTKYGIDLIYQASGVQVNFMSQPFFENHALSVKEFTFAVSDESYSNFMKFAITNSGAPYSLREAFNILTYKWFGKKVFKTGVEFMCARIGAIVFDDFIETVLQTFNDTELATPKDVYDVCEKYQKELLNGNI